MEVGASIFFTDYSIAPTALAVALEERGFDSPWVAEHSHVLVTCRFTHPLGEAALTKGYFDVMDPFVTPSAAAAVTTGLELGTAICLVIQRDTIQTAKLVASLDQVSKGRFLFGIGCGWNAEEMEDHARRAIRYGDGIVPEAPSAGSGSPEEFMPRLRQMAEEADSDPQSLSVTLGGAPEDIDVLKRNCDLGVSRMTVRLPPAKKDEILPVLDRWANLIPQVKN
jgi:alkanesulfonate monooxygenase SsuD/methylene tetrahydromethanopterin reductase-like flavin-dependent oxidoreductase (luciferase family)